MLALKNKYPRYTVQLSHTLASVFCQTQWITSHVYSLKLHVFVLITLLFCVHSSSMWNTAKALFRRSFCWEEVLLNRKVQDNFTHEVPNNVQTLLFETQISICKKTPSDLIKNFPKQRFLSSNPFSLRKETIFVRNLVSQKSVLICLVWCLGFFL